MPFNEELRNSFIPEVSYDKEIFAKLPIITLCGTIGSGKGTLASYIQKEFSFPHYTASNVLREEARKLGIPTPTRAQLDNISKQIEDLLGGDGITQLLLIEAQQELQVNPAPGIIIDGLRLQMEVEHLRQFPYTKVIFLEAPLSIRYSRILQRGRKNDISNWDDFIEKDTQEAKWLEGIKARATDVVDTNKPLYVVQQEITELIHDDKKSATEFRVFSPAS